MREEGYTSNNRPKWKKFLLSSVEIFQFKGRIILSEDGTLIFNEIIISLTLLSSARVKHFWRAGHNSGIACKILAITANLVSVISFLFSSSLTNSFNLKLSKTFNEIGENKTNYKMDQTHWGEKITSIWHLNKRFAGDF